MSSLTPGGPTTHEGKNQRAIDRWNKNKELLCDRCGEPLDWNPLEHYSMEAIKRAKANDSVFYLCGPCNNKLPDVDPRNLIAEPVIVH